LNETLIAPIGIVTDAGTVTPARLLESFTTVPPLGEGPLSVAVPVDGLPPETESGFRLTENSVIGFRVRIAV